MYSRAIKKFQPKERVVFKQGVAALCAAVGVLAVFALGGCGGGDSTDTSTTVAATVTVPTGSISKAAYTTKANDICLSEVKKISGVVKNAIATNAAVKLNVILPAVEGMLTRLENTPAPKSEQAQVEAFLTELKANLEELQGKAEARMSDLAGTFKPSGDKAALIKLEACELG